MSSSGHVEYTFSGQTQIFRTATNISLIDNYVFHQSTIKP